MKFLKNRFFALALGVTLLAASALAADVDGKWAGTMSTPMGDIPVAFTFKADGATLNGSTTGPDGMDIKIANGKVDGANVTFTVTFDFGGMPFVLNYKGVLSGTDMKFTIDVGGMPMELSLKKSA
jgi:opacity protein-like surface antigen